MPQPHDTSLIGLDDSRSILDPGLDLSVAAREQIASIGFENSTTAIERLQEVAQTDYQQSVLIELLPGFLFSLAETPDCDRAIVNFLRFTRAVENADDLFEFLAAEPRAMEILLRLFVGSQFLTEILLRQPEALRRLTQHKRVSEFKSREEFISEGRLACQSCETIPELMAALRSYQQWELLRIAACDTFWLMDLKTVTRQVSLLADAIIQVAMEGLAKLKNQPLDDFAVIAFGKLGGGELNYSSDIDLVFVCESNAERYWSFAQQLVKVLTEFTSLGFLYRVDLRLRPWGNSGPLVATADSWVDYMTRHGQLWEHQALLKARTVAGNFLLGDQLLAQLQQSSLNFSTEEVRASVFEIKQQITRRNTDQGKHFGEVKTGQGGIRDIEFLVQFLQLAYGQRIPSIRCTGTLDGLIRLAEADLIHAKEYRTLSNAYVILRTVEHSLQLMHNQQEHSLPTSKQELAYLARRLDFNDAEVFLDQFREQTKAVSKIFRKHLDQDFTDDSTLHAAYGTTCQIGMDVFDPELIDSLLTELGDDCSVGVKVWQTTNGVAQLAIAGRDLQSSLPVICGLLAQQEFNVVSADVAPVFELGVAEQALVPDDFFVARFEVSAANTDQEMNWEDFTDEIRNVVEGLSSRSRAEFHSSLIGRLGDVFNPVEGPLRDQLAPVTIQFEQDAGSVLTKLSIQAEDVPGFLYELIFAIGASGLRIERMEVRTENHQVRDIFYVTDPLGASLLEEQRQNQLRAAIVLTKHFTHLLPNAPNPETAVTHFRELLESLFQHADWLNQFKTLENPKVLSAVAQLLGVSDFLWEDFLRIQYENLFPVVTDIAGLEVSYQRQDLETELNHFLAEVDGEDKVRILNEFKDRAMMRADMRHILGLQHQFGSFGQELTDIAETVVNASLNISHDRLVNNHGLPRKTDGAPVRLTVFGLGKCGGRELGYASDIELMFVFDCDGQTDGPHSISAIDFYQKLVREFQNSIHARQRRIFEIDLRLRPYGNAGSLAVSKEIFTAYYDPSGPAWPFERQAMVKLRPICGDTAFGEELIHLRDQFIYIGEPFDVTAMRAMREKQIRQFVQPGTFHAKLSPGGLVDCEYFVQGLQMTFGHLLPEIRVPNTREALKGLAQAGVLCESERVQLRDAYRFLRRLIDAMRIVRGDATDLAIPEPGTDQFAFLARRLKMQNSELHHEIERNTCQVVDIVSSFEEFLTRG